MEGSLGLREGLSPRRGRWRRRSLLPGTGGPRPEHRALRPRQGEPAGEPGGAFREAPFRDGQSGSRHPEPRDLRGADVACTSLSPRSALGAIFGVVLGMLAAFYRRADAPIMRFMDIILAFPGYHRGADRDRHHGPQRGEHDHRHRRVSHSTVRETRPRPHPVGQGEAVCRGRDGDRRVRRRHPQQATSSPTVSHRSWCRPAC